jgi:hypothetical protein
MKASKKQKSFKPTTPKDEAIRQREVEEVAKYNSPEGVEIFNRLQAIVRGECKK